LIFVFAAFALFYSKILFPESTNKANTPNKNK
jgi:hypothetical protein